VARTNCKSNLVLSSMESKLASIHFMGYKYPSDIVEEAERMMSAFELVYDGIPISIICHTIMFERGMLKKHES